MDGDNLPTRLLNQVEKYQVPLILGLLGLIFVGFGFLFPKLSQNTKKEIQVQSSNLQQVSASKIVVDVSGAVKVPGVYNLPENSRVADAIEAAGGFNDQVDNTAVAKTVNLASKVTDGQKVYINSLADAVSSATSQTLGALSTGSINVNTASKTELDVLPGVGEVTAGKIIAGRPYQTIKDLLTRKIVGQATFDKIKDKISVN